MFRFKIWDRIVRCTYFRTYARTFMIVILETYVEIYIFQNLEQNSFRKIQRNDERLEFIYLEFETSEQPIKILILILSVWNYLSTLIFLLTRHSIIVLDQYYY